MEAKKFITLFCNNRQCQTHSCSFNNVHFLLAASSEFKHEILARHECKVVVVTMFYRLGWRRKRGKNLTIKRLYELSSRTAFENWKTYKLTRLNWLIFNNENPFENDIIQRSEHCVMNIFLNESEQKKNYFINTAVLFLPESFQIVLQVERKPWTTPLGCE